MFGKISLDKDTKKQLNELIELLKDFKKLATTHTIEISLKEKEQEFKYNIGDNITVTGST